MIEETGVIKSVEANRIIIHTQLKNSCSACEQRSHCGTGVIARAVASRSHELDISAESVPDLQPGQQVRLGIPEADLLRASASVYLLPLFALILGALTGQFLLPMLGLFSELWLIAFTFVWVAMALKLLKIRTHHQCKERFQPHFLGVSGSDSNT